MYSTPFPWGLRRRDLNHSHGHELWVKTSIVPMGDGAPRGKRRQKSQSPFISSPRIIGGAADEIWPSAFQSGKFHADRSMSNSGLGCLPNLADGEVSTAGESGCGPRPALVCRNRTRCGGALNSLKAWRVMTRSFDREESVSIIFFGLALSLVFLGVARSYWGWFR